MRKVLSIIAAFLITISFISIGNVAKADDSFTVNKLHFTTSSTIPTDGSINSDALHAVNMFLDLEQSLLNEANFTDLYIDILVSSILSNRIEYSDGSVAFHGDRETLIIMNASSSLDVLLISDLDSSNMFNSYTWIDSKDILLALIYQYDFINQKSLSIKIDNVLAKTQSIFGKTTTAKAKSETDGLYTYVLNDDMTITITGFDWSNNHGDIYIPEMLGNRMVSAIGESAFATTGNTAVKITLPDNIRSIDALAFQGVSISYINIPLNTVKIEEGAFAQCSVMRFNVADGHTVFATIDNALYNKQTKTLIAWPVNKEISVIPNGIKRIGAYAFWGRDFQNYVYNEENPYFPFTDYYVLPESVESIGDHAFEGTKLSLDISNVSVIGDFAFQDSRMNLMLPLSVTKIGKHAFQSSRLVFSNEKRVATSETFCETPYSIDDYAFYYCDSVYADVYLRLGNVVSIGAHAFEYCEIAPSCDFADITYLGEAAFKGESKFNGAVMSQDSIYLTNDSLQKIPADTFAYAEISSLIVGPSVTVIGESAFQGCEKLSSIVLSEGLQEIKDEVFKDCKSLTAIQIPASVTMIGNDVFTGCAESFVVTVEAGSYGEVWARTCGYAYVVNGQVEDTSWLDW